MIIKMVTEFKLTVVHVAHPKPDADLCMCVELPLDKKLWKIRTGSRAFGPLGRGLRAGGPAFSKTQVILGKLTQPKGK